MEDHGRNMEEKFNMEHHELQGVKKKNLWRTVYGVAVTYS